MGDSLVRCPKCGLLVERLCAAGAEPICPKCQTSQGALASSQAETETAERESLAGQSLGDFEIIELLGRGGMGEVYRARQTSLGRLVAVKVLPEHHAKDREFVARFGREARAAAAINHPNIAQIIVVGQDKGRHYFAMELVDGESLASVLRREGRLPPGRALDYLRQVAAALAKAHAAGIIHRDIKPANLLLTRDGLVKVADFGLAIRPGVDVRITCVDSTPGTPLYMPPEVIQGGEADARADLYSLGAAFYHLLAGRPPFEGTNAAAIHCKHLHAQPQPLQELVPDVPPPIARVIHTLLSKAPAARYPSAEALLEALSKPAAQRESAAKTPVKPPSDATTPALPQHPKREKFQPLPPVWSVPTPAPAKRKRVLSLLFGFGRFRLAGRTHPTNGTGHLPAPPAWAKVSLRQRQMAHQAGVPVAIEVPLEGAQPLRLAYVAPGEFTMGATTFDSVRPHDELPPHRVRITRGFYLGIHEVTAGQWKAVMGKDPSDFGTDGTPVECVNWLDCQDFLERLNKLQRGTRVFRLPTEAEWEYACRAGTTTEYPWGNGIGGCAQYANVADECAKDGIASVLEYARGERDGSVQTAPVGGYEPNAWGLYDMIGNVQEWCQDWYSPTYYSTSPVDDPPGPRTGQNRVSRGGCWASKPTSCRSAFRMGIPPASGDNPRRPPPRRLPRARERMGVRARPFRRANARWRQSAHDCGQPRRSLLRGRAQRGPRCLVHPRGGPRQAPHRARPCRRPPCPASRRIQGHEENVLRRLLRRRPCQAPRRPRRHRRPRVQGSRTRNPHPLAHISPRDPRDNRDHSDLNGRPPQRPQPP